MSGKQTTEHMSPAAIRSWIGLYLLILTGAVGGTLLLAGGVLPMNDADLTSCFEIIIPFLLGQLALTFRFYANPADHQTRVKVPKWVVKGPPVIVTILLVAGFTVMIVGALRQSESVPSGEKFKALLTFCVALLNASTVYITTKYFESKQVAADREAA
jgi:hypothetical protein